MFHYTKRHRRRLRKEEAARRETGYLEIRNHDYRVEEVDQIEEHVVNDRQIPVALNDQVNEVLDMNMEDEEILTGFRYESE